MSSLWYSRQTLDHHRAEFSGRGYRSMHSLPVRAESGFSAKDEGNTVRTNRIPQSHESRFALKF
jgi:hypothetical protein